jgi:hypothetical protein
MAATFAVTLAQPAWAESAAEIAVREAQQYKGQTITIVWEAGLQALDPLNFSGPKWKELTGIDVKVIEVSTAEMFTKIMQDYKSGAGAYDALNVIPAWMPDLVQAGALENLESYVDKYGFRAELQKIAPTYRDNQMTVNGKIYGFPDDGDVFLFYYRKDIFARDDLAFRETTTTSPRQTWAEFDETGADRGLKKGIYGAAFRERPTPCSCSGASATRRQVLRRRQHEGDRQRPDRRQGIHRDAQREPLHAAWRGEVRLRREPGRVPQGPERHDHLLAAVLPFRRGLSRGREGAELGAEVPDRRQGRLRPAPGRPSATGGRLRAVGGFHQQEQGSRVPVHPVA